MNLQLDSQFLLESSLIQAMLRNRDSISHWETCLKKLEELKVSLKFFVAKMQHEIFVPIGTKALMKGTLQHTNEILISIGGDWFIKTSEAKAVEVCQRRIDACKKMLAKLEEEKTFLENRKNFPQNNEAFCDKDKQEIVEPYNEEEEKLWRAKHKQNVKKHKEKLAEVREQLKEKKTDNEEDLWKHLDLLEIQEELQDELDRIQTESDENEDHGDDDTDDKDEGLDSDDSAEYSGGSDNVGDDGSKDLASGKRKCVRLLEDKTIITGDHKPQQPQAISEEIKESKNLISEPVAAVQRPVSKFKKSKQLKKK